MTAVTTLPAQNLLNALDGIAYLTDLRGTILGVGVENWNSFNRNNNAGALPSDAVIGRNIFDFISGEEVQKNYASMFEAILKRKRGMISFPMRCDSPNVRREMRMSVSPIFKDGMIAAILFQSQILSEIDRPPMNIFEYKPRGAGGSKTAEIVKICSYCHNIANDNPKHNPPGDNTSVEWITPEDYYRSGGDTCVLLSHSICPPCFAKLQV